MIELFFTHFLSAWFFDFSPPKSFIISNLSRVSEKIIIGNENRALMPIFRQILTNTSQKIYKKDTKSLNFKKMILSLNVKIWLRFILLNLFSPFLNNFPLQKWHKFYLPDFLTLHNQQLTWMSYTKPKSSQQIAITINMFCFLSS